MTRAATALESAFLEIRQQFFPDWDRDRLWGVKESTNGGCCNPKTRTIEITARYVGDKRDEQLIHEICHVVTPREYGGHGEHWHQQMEMSAKRADELGRPELAEMLRRKWPNEVDPIEDARLFIAGLNPGRTLQDMTNLLEETCRFLSDETVQRLYLGYQAGCPS